MWIKTAGFSPPEPNEFLASPIGAYTYANQYFSVWRREGMQLNQYVPSHGSYWWNVDRAPVSCWTAWKGRWPSRPFQSSDLGKACEKINLFPLPARMTGCPYGWNARLSLDRIKPQLSRTSANAPIRSKEYSG